MYTFVYNSVNNYNVITVHTERAHYLYAYALYLMVWIQRYNFPNTFDDNRKDLNREKARRLVLYIFRYLERIYVKKRNINKINPFTEYKVFSLEDKEAFDIYMETKPFNLWNRVRDAVKVRPYAKAILEEHAMGKTQREIAEGRAFYEKELETIHLHKKYKGITLELLAHLSSD